MTEVKVGQTVYTGSNFGFVERVDGDKVTLSFTESKDYSSYSWTETQSIDYVRQCIERQDKRERERLEEQERLRLASTLKVVHEGLKNLLKCRTCRVILSYDPENLRLSINGRTRQGECPRCGTTLYTSLDSI